MNSLLVYTPLAINDTPSHNIFLTTSSYYCLQPLLFNSSCVIDLSSWVYGKLFERRKRSFQLLLTFIAPNRKLGPYLLVDEHRCLFLFFSWLDVTKEILPETQQRGLEETSRKSFITTTLATSSMHTSIHLLTHLFNVPTTMSMKSLQISSHSTIARRRG